MEWGYPAYIKRVALSLRAELALSAFDPIDAHDACDCLGIPILDMTSLEDAPSALAHFSGVASSKFSAVTGFDGTSRFIVVNDTHHPYRQASSIAHELGHALLQHPPAHVLSGDGVRNFDGEIEEQAAFFSGVLLLPDEACRMIMKRHMSLREASRLFGVSESMVDYRLNKSGARTISKRQVARN
ncbi:MAG: hypothetical protein CVT66_10585 [Actinobacteria bacterium HGW-Actinobacteria-6]|jgi:hypothetical protein|nr:MAG: hypothetical protein CVT66_10585 [Actinobacteria bacterium HGW-Actinobacteria-6]